MAHCQSDRTECGLSTQGLRMHRFRGVLRVHDQRRKVWGRIREAIHCSRVGEKLWRPICEGDGLQSPGKTGRPNKIGPLVGFSFDGLTSEQPVSDMRTSQDLALHLCYINGDAMLLRFLLVRSLSRRNWDFAHA